MEDKNENLGSHSNPSSPGSPGGGGSSKSELSTAEREEINHSAIKQECERALTALDNGNHTEALTLIDEACQRHEKCAVFHRCKATICVSLAGITDDEKAKKRYIKSCIESARKACSLSPNSMEYAYFYANRLYDAAQDRKDYEEVLQECERALAVQNPTDPATESFREEPVLFAAEARLYVRQHLKSLIQKANIASIATWLRDFGKREGEENFRLIPIRKPDTEKTREENHLRAVSAASKTGIRSFRPIP